MIFSNKQIPDIVQLHAEIARISETNLNLAKKSELPLILNNKLAMVVEIELWSFNFKFRTLIPFYQSQTLNLKIISFFVSSHNTEPEIQGKHLLTEAHIYNFYK